jgi:hypothetical protein
VHDYEVHNDTADEAKARRDQITRQRRQAGQKGGLASGEARSKRSKAEANGSSKREAPSHPIPSHPSGFAGGESKRPLFTGRRLTVFKWQVDKFLGILGPEHAAAFDVHAWFFELDARLVAENAIPPARDGGAWLQSEFVREAQRRGIPVRMMAAPAVGKGTTRLAAAIATIRAQEDV